jgi:hypothetical protein
MSCWHRKNNKRIKTLCNNEVHNFYFRTYYDDQIKGDVMEHVVCILGR